MASMQEIIVKITGQDGLSPMLARNANELKKVHHNARSASNTLKHGFETNSTVMLQARKNVENYNNSLETARKQITGGLTPAMQGINITPLQKIGINAEQASPKISNLKSHIDKLHNTFSGLTGVVSGLIGLSLGAWLKDSIDKAKASKDSWNKLEAVLHEHGGTVKEAKKEVLELADKYGFTAGEVREASRIIMQAGMSYKDLVKDQGALQAAMALSVASNKPVSQSARDLQRAYQGNGRALQVLGLKIDDYKNKTTGMVDKNKLNSALLEKTIGQLEEQGRSYEATTMRYERSIQRLQVSIGEKLLPILTPFLDTMTLVINKLAEAPSYVHYFTAGLLGIAATGMILAPVITSLGTVWGLLKNIGGLFGKKQKLNWDCDVCPTGTQIGDISRGNKNKNIKNKKIGSLSGINRVKGRVPGLGRFSSVLGGLGNRGRWGVLSRLGGSLSGLGRLGSLAAGAARFAGPLGLALTAATTGYGAYTGWNETKGPVQEKAKGAMGGAVESLSFGIINKTQVMEGINWLYSTLKEIPSQIQNTLENITHIITSPFTNAWNSTKNIANNNIIYIINLLKSLINDAKNILTTILPIITIPFFNAWNNAKNIVNNNVNSVLGILNKLIHNSRTILNNIIHIITNPFVSAWSTVKSITSSGISYVIDGFRSLPGKVSYWLQQLNSTVHTGIGKILGPLKSVYCMIMGCSPGIIPAFQKLSQKIPQNINKTLPHLEKLNKAINIPKTNFKVSKIPTLSFNSLNSNFNVPLNPSNSGYNMITSPGKKVVTNSRTVYNDHTHYHDPITINAKHMSLQEFRSTLLSVLEESNRRYIPP